MEKNFKWTFAPKGPLDMGQGSEDASFPQFEKYALRNLIREYTQNSLDAHDNTSPNPVRIMVSVSSLSIDEFPNLTRELLPHLKAASDSCKRDNFSRDPYPPKIEALTKWVADGEIPVLIFSDYYTVGMPYKDENETGENSAFNACVRQCCASYKPENSAGGSHGLGKTVGFVNSNINAVIYSTFTTENETFCEGVIKLCDHRVDGQSFKAHGFYDSEGGLHPGSGEAIPEVFQRSVPGTDAYVLGIDLTEEEKVEMKRNFLRGFFMAILQEKITANLFGEEFNHNNIIEKTEHYFNSTEDIFDSIKNKIRDAGIFFSPRPYLIEAVSKAKEDDEHLVYTTNEVTPEKWSNFSATLYLWKNDDLKAKYRDTIIYMRDKLMTIEVRRGKERQGYRGVVVVNEGSSELRKIENVTHDKWVNAELRRLSTSEKNAITLVQKQLEEFVTTCINLTFPDNGSEERSLQSLSSIEVNLVGNSLHKSTEDEAVWPTSNELDEIKATHKKSKGSLVILETGKSKKKRRKGQAGNTTRGGNSTPEKTEVPSMPPAPPGAIPPRPTPPPSDKLPNGSIKKDELETENGNHENQVSDEPITHLRELRLLPRAFKLIPLSDSEYTCKLIIRSPKDCVGCSVALYISALGGKSLPLELEKVGDGLSIVGNNKNEIRGFDLQKDSANIIYFTPVNKSINYSLVPKAYETR